MNNAVSITTAFTLPWVEVEALIHGQTIVAIAKAFTTSGRTFALYPSEVSSTLPPNKVYRSAILSQPKVCSESLKSTQASVKAWARCEGCQVLDETTPLTSLSKLTIWTTEALQEIITQQQRVFLVYLRVYKLLQPLEASVRSKGQFVALTKPLASNNSLPVLSDEKFVKRQKQLMNLELPTHPELEELQASIAKVVTTDAKARKLDEDLRAFLGWADVSTPEVLDPDLAWINQVAKVGNSSDGDLFEKLVRKSFIKLGFENSNSNPKTSLDPEGCGGAGGLDFYCEKPYKVVGECKATKTEVVPDGTAAQLLKLGENHLQEGYKECIKVIMAAGELTAYAEQTAIRHEMNVIRPETLQRLVEVKAKYTGAIDLIDLEPCLRAEPFGENADTKLNDYIDKVLQGIKLRSQLVQIVKELTQPNKKQIEVVEICHAYNITTFGLSNRTAWLDNSIIYELLIELSSPLAGYLGRLRAGSLNSDRFYYLRDLPVETMNQAH